MAQLPPSSVGVETEAALEAFRKMSRSAVGELKANEGILKQKIDSLSTSIGQQESRIQQEQEQAAISRSELTAALTDAKSTFQNLKSAMELEFKGLQQEDRVTLEKHLSDSETIVNKYISEIESKKKEAASIVQSVGDILTTGTYKDTAESEARLANTFRLVTIVLFSIGILIVVSNYAMHAIAAYNQTHFEETPWFLLSRFATALAVALPALYTARESARHRTNADRARQRELELTTLGPFIELLPDLKKQEIRDRLTDRYFGGEVEKHEIPAPIDAETLAKLATSLAKLKTVQ